MGCDAIFVVFLGDTCEASDDNEQYVPESANYRYSLGKFLIALIGNN